MSNADFVSRQLTFVWSPVVSDCPATHYNILASNCGSCPTTTNHTNVTCTDVLNDGIVCTFTIQTVVCENITGNISYQIRVNISIPLNTLGILNSSTSRAYIISISSLATALIISVMVSITMTIIITTVTRRKVKIKILIYN